MDRHSLEARKQRALNLYNADLGGQIIFSIAINETATAPRPFPCPTNIQERIEHSWECYCRMQERVDWLHDDNLPFLDVYTGTEIFAEAFGCKVFYPDDDMPVARPLITDPADVAKLKVPELGSSSLAVLFDIADELRGRGGDDALLKIVDIQSPMDIAALIWDKNEFYPAFIEAPEAVKELAAKTNALLTAFLDEWFSRYGTNYIAHWPVYYMEGGITLSEDEIGVVNPAIFREFFLPELTRLSERYGGIGIHCCADSRHQWDNFLLIPGLRMLQISPENISRQAFAFFADHTAMMHGPYDDEPARTWPSKLPHNARVSFRIGVNTREEAIETSSRMREAIGDFVGC